MNEKTRAAVAKQIAFIMMLVAFGWPLIFGLPKGQGGLDNRLIVGLFLVILGLVGAFVYLECVKEEIIAALKNRDDKDLAQES
jgi:hypothetical protein